MGNNELKGIRRGDNKSAKAAKFGKELAVVAAVD